MAVCVVSFARRVGRNYLRQVDGRSLTFEASGSDNTFQTDAMGKSHLTARILLHRLSASKLGFAVSRIQSHAYYAENTSVLRFVSTDAAHR
jgi:hypothetical protein